MTDYSWLLRKSEIEVNGKKLSLQEITSKQREKLKEYQKKSDDSSLSAAYIVTCGCDTFKNMKPEELLDVAPDAFIVKVATEIAQLSGIIDAKKTGPGSDDSPLG